MGKDEAARALLDYAGATFYSDKDPVKALSKLDKVLLDHAQVLGEAKTPEPLYGEICLRRGLLLVYLGRFDEARRVLEEVSTLGTVEKDGEFYFNLGFCYMELHEPERAKPEFLRALDIGLPDDHSLKTHFYLGVVYFRTRSYGRALREFEFCEANINKSTLPLRGLYKWLALTCKNIGREENARIYSELASRN